MQFDKLVRPQTMSLVRRIHSEENNQLFLLIEPGSDDFAIPWQLFIADCGVDSNSSNSLSIATYRGCIDQPVIKECSTWGDQDEVQFASTIRRAVLHTRKDSDKVIFSFGKSDNGDATHELTLKKSLDSEGKIKQRIAVIPMHFEPVSLYRFLITGAKENESLLADVELLTKQNKELREISDTEVKELEQLVANASERENRLLKSFMLVLNAKKDRIAELESELQSVRKEAPIVKTEIKSESPQQNTVKSAVVQPTQKRGPGRPKKAAASASTTKAAVIDVEPSTRLKNPPKTTGRVYRRTASNKVTVKRSESDLQAASQINSTTCSTEVPVRMTRGASRRLTDASTVDTSKRSVEVKQSNAMDCDSLPQSNESTHAKVEEDEMNSETDSDATTLSGIDLDISAYHSDSE